MRSILFVLDRPPAGHLQRRRRRAAAVERGRRDLRQAHAAAAAVRRRRSPRCRCGGSASQLPDELLDLLRYGRGVDNRRLKRPASRTATPRPARSRPSSRRCACAARSATTEPDVPLRARRRAVLPPLPRRRPRRRGQLTRLSCPRSHVDIERATSPSSPSTTPSAATRSTRPGRRDRGDLRRARGRRRRRRRRRHRRAAGVLRRRRPVPPRRSPREGPARHLRGLPAGRPLAAARPSPRSTARPSAPA